MLSKNIYLEDIIGTCHISLVFFLSLSLNSLGKHFVHIFLMVSLNKGQKIMNLRAGRDIQN